MEQFGIGAAFATGGGFAVPVGGELGAAGSACAILKTLAEAVGGGSVTSESSAFEAGDATGRVFGAADAFEVALAELVESIHFTGAGSEVEQLDRGLVVALAATPAQQALGLLQTFGW